MSDGIRNINIPDTHRFFDATDGDTYILRRGYDSNGVYISQPNRAKVIRAMCGENNVAVKKITLAVDSYRREPAKACLREIKLLEWFRGHGHITQLQGLFCAPVFNTLTVFLYEDCMVKSLHQVITTEPPLDYHKIRTYIYQTLCGLKFIHSADVIHRDIRPENLLIGEDGVLRIASFKLAVSMQDAANYRLTDPTDEMQWYSAPETRTGLGDYGTKIDIWGVGCTLGELIHGRPIFKGEHQDDPLYTLRTYLGPVKQNDLDGMLPEPKRIMSRLPLGDECSHSDPFLTLFNEGSWCHSWPRKEKDTVASILTDLLYLNPIGRATSASALKKYFVVRPKIHHEYCCAPFDFKFENAQNLTFNDIARDIMETISHCPSFAAGSAESQAVNAQAEPKRSALSVVEQDKSVDRALHQFAREPGDPWNLTGKIEIEEGELEYQSQGSYANVYKVMCKDGSGRRMVALKKLKTGDNPNRASVQIHRELAVWASLKNPRIAQVLGYIVYDKKGNAALVSHWYEKGSLVAFLDNHPKLSEAQQHDLSVDVLHGLHYLHTLAVPVVHGDLTPKNILIDEENRAVLNDFGMSKFQDRSLTGLTSTKVEGYIRYLPRELLNNQPRTIKGDIWAYGCICFYIRHGEPYGLDTDSQQVRMLIQDGVLPLLFPPTLCGWNKVMAECWVYDPLTRAITKDIVEFITSPIFTNINDSICATTTYL